MLPATAGDNSRLAEITLSYIVNLKPGDDGSMVDCAWNGWRVVRITRDLARRETRILLAGPEPRP